jgi:hypothetical protein
MGRIGFPEISVQDYRSMLRNIPEERRSQAKKCMHSVTFGAPSFFMAVKFVKTYDGGLQTA